MRRDRGALSLMHQLEQRVDLIEAQVDVQGRSDAQIGAAAVGQLDQQHSRQDDQAYLRDLIRLRHAAQSLTDRVNRLAGSEQRAAELNNKRQ